MVTDISFRVVKKHEQDFIRYFSLINTLHILPNHDPDRHEFIQFCRLNCQDSKFLDPILEFELHYRPDEAVQWYTRSSGFPSKFINTICRTQNPVFISKIRYFLKHLYEQITRLYVESLVWIPNSIIIYRGQKLSNRELKRLIRTKGKLIFTTAFLSATGDDDVAFIFSGYTDHLNKLSQDEVAIFFKILIRTNTTRSKPFAYIQEYSNITDEKEILISIGTIFSCVNICKRGDRLYEVFLTRGEDEEKIEKELLNKTTNMTLEEFFTSMNIHIKPLNDSDRRLIDLLSEKVDSNTVNSAPIDISLELIEKSTVNANHNHLIIWLDFYIGEDHVCIDLKEKLATSININTDEPSLTYDIDRLILHNDTQPHRWNELIVVKTIPECLELIDRNYHKKIFLITSGSLGQTLIPRVSTDYPYVDKIFLFCGSIAFHVDWAIDFTDKLLMYNFPDDLFARVVYEIGVYYMEQGITSIDTDNPELALYYFYIAKKLIMRANHIFHPFWKFSLNRIEELIMHGERRLDQDTVRCIQNNLYHGERISFPINTCL